MEQVQKLFFKGKRRAWDPIFNVLEYCLEFLRPSTTFPGMPIYICVFVSFIPGYYTRLSAGPA